MNTFTGCPAPDKLGTYRRPNYDAFWDILASSNDPPPSFPPLPPLPSFGKDPQTSSLKERHASQHAQSMKHIQFLHDRIADHEKLAAERRIITERLLNQLKAHSANQLADFKAEITQLKSKQEDQEVQVKKLESKLAEERAEHGKTKLKLDTLQIASDANDLALREEKLAHAVTKRRFANKEVHFQV